MLHSLHFLKKKNHIILEQATGASFYTTVTCLSNHVLHLFQKRSFFNYVYLYAVVVGGAGKDGSQRGHQVPWNWVSRWL